MPSRWQVSLIGPVGVDVPVEAPHAVVSGWLDTRHDAPRKPYSIAPPFTDGGETVLGVGLLDDALAIRLTDGARPGSAVRLGRHHYRVAGPPQRTASMTWDDFGRLSPCRAWDVQFRSPTTFRRGGRSAPWPAPESVLTSIASRVPLPVDRPAELARHVWVSDLDGSSDVLTIKQHLVSGFVGRVRYECDGPDPIAAQVDRLFRLAPFSGAGSHTAYGLGVVTLSPTRRGARGARRAG